MYVHSIILGHWIILASAISTQKDSRSWYVGVTDGREYESRNVEWPHTSWYILCKFCNRLKRRQRKYKYMYGRIHRHKYFISLYFAAKDNLIPSRHIYFYNENYIVIYFDFIDDFLSWNEVLYRSSEPQ
jgi:hypothetical protein